MGFPRQEYWSALPFPSPRDLPDPGFEPMSPALAGGFFTTESLGKPKTIYVIQANQKPMNPPSKEILKWTITKQSEKSSLVQSFLGLWCLLDVQGKAIASGAER